VSVSRLTSRRRMMRCRKELWLMADEICGSTLKADLVMVDGSGTWSLEPIIYSGRSGQLLATESCERCIAVIVPVAVITALRNT